jgi:hypothetical protein
MDNNINDVFSMGDEEIKKQLEAIDKIPDEEIKGVLQIHAL